MRTRILVAEDIYFIPISPRRGSLVRRSGERVALLWGVDRGDSLPEIDRPHEIRTPRYLDSELEIEIAIGPDDGNWATAALVSGSLIPRYTPPVRVRS